jgi:hypothetical protein
MHYLNVADCVCIVYDIQVTYLPCFSEYITSSLECHRLKKKKKRRTYCVPFFSAYTIKKKVPGKHWLGSP